MACGVDVAREADVVRRTRAGATRHARPRGRATQAHVVQGGTDAWHGPHESTWTLGWRHVAGGLASKGPTVKGPG